MLTDVWFGSIMNKAAISILIHFIDYQHSFLLYIYTPGIELLGYRYMSILFI